MQRQTFDLFDIIPSCVVIIEIRNKIKIKTKSTGSERRLSSISLNNFFGKVKNFRNKSVLILVRSRGMGTVNTYHIFKYVCMS